MKNYSKITPEGTRDFLFEECDVRRRIETSLSELFKKKNYRRVITPTIEFYDVFNRESAGMLLENMYKLTDNRGRLLVMRPDNTMPIARMAATRLNREAYPLRLYYAQNVFVNNESLTGRKDEISQSGIELIGAHGKLADLEVIAMAHEALKSCGASGFRIEIGHAGFFNAILDKMNLDKECRDEVCKLTELKNYAALNDLLDQIGDTEETNAIKKLPRLFGTIEVLDRAAEMYRGELANEALEYLRELYGTLEDMGLGGEISIDLGIVNRSNYYTGVVFRGYTEGSGLTVLSGGRYNNLIREFGAEDAPAIGFGIDVSALAQTVYQNGFDERKQAPSVLIFAESGKEGRAFAYAAELSDREVPNEIFLGNNFDEALLYARKKNFLRIDAVRGDGIDTVKAGE